MSWIVTVNGTIESYNDTGLVNGITYFYSIAAQNSVGTGPAANCSVMPVGIPPPPTNVTAVPGDTSLTLSWSTPITDGGFPLTGYTIFRQEGSQSATQIDSVGPDVNSYVDNTVAHGRSYSYYLLATNQKGASHPSAQTSPFLVHSVLNMEIYSDTHARSLGYSVDLTIHAVLAKGGSPVSGIEMVLYYSVTSGATWNEISSAVTSTDGNCSLEWLPTATGTFLIRASWSGDDNYSAAEATTTLAVTSSDQYYFTVQSNSTVSQLSFNSTSMQLSFTVSGPTGTLGYTRIIISKQLVADGTSIRISMDGAPMNYSLTSTENSWVLYFTYHHSSHQVVASLSQVDTTGPVISVEYPRPGEFVNQNSIAVSWNASDTQSGVNRTEYALDGAEYAIIYGAGPYSRTLNGLPDGEHTLTIIAFDNFGNNNTTSVTFTVDTVTPSLTITAPEPDSWHNTSEVNFTWTSSDSGSGLAYFTVAMDGGEWINVTTSYYQFSGLADGGHIAHIRSYDRAGNYMGRNVEFNIDTAGPTLDIVAPTPDALIFSSNVSVSWTSTSASGISDYWIKADGEQWEWINATSSSSCTLTSLADGVHVVSVKAQDNASNWNQTSVSFTIDIAPTVIAHSPTGSNVAISSAISVWFSKTMNETSVEIAVNGVKQTPAWNGKNATILQSSALGYGTTYSVTVSGMDLAGNAMELRTWTFTTMKNEGIVSGIIEDANGDPIANATVTLSNGMSTRTDASGAFAFHNVTAGTYNVTISKDGYKPITQTLSTAAGRTSDLGSLSLEASTTSNSDYLVIIAVAVVVVVALLGIISLNLRHKKKE
jgi:hypothetical protein